MVVQDKQGLTDFHALRRAIEGRGDGLIFFAFDLLHLDGRDVRYALLVERRARLKDLLGARSPRSAIQFSDHFEDDGAAFFAAAEQLGVEGIVRKRRRAATAAGPQGAG